MIKPSLLKRHVIRIHRPWTTLKGQCERYAIHFFVEMNHKRVDETVSLELKAGNNDEPN